MLDKMNPEYSSAPSLRAKRGNPECPLNRYAGLPRYARNDDHIELISASLKPMQDRMPRRYAPRNDGLDGSPE
jgi:hypothetical protein